MKKTAILGIVVLSLNLLAGCSSKAPDKVSSVPASAAESSQTVDAFGVINATDMKNINIDFPSIIKSVNVNEGQKVKSGDSLITLDISEFQRQIKEKQLELEAAKNEVMRINQDLSARQRNMEKNIDPDVKKLLSELESAQKIYNQSLSELVSKQTLLESGTISQNELDEFKKSVDANKQTVTSLQLSIDSTKYSKQNEIDQLKSSLDEKNTRVTSLQAELKSMNSKLEKTYMKQQEIICDIPNGLVYDIGYVQGDIVNPAKKVLSLMDMDSLIVEANVAEDFIKDVKVGDNVTIIPQADKTKIYMGKVTGISDKAIQVNGETDIQVRISIDDKDDFLKPEFNVDVKIDTGNK